MSRFVIKHVTFEGLKEKIEYEEEIDSMEVCKLNINGICSNEKCYWLGSGVFNSNCDSEEDCKYFVKEDGIIEVSE